jgi:cell division protein FtsB
MAHSRRSRRLGRRRLWVLAVAGAALTALLYYKPLHSYFRTKSELAQRTAEVKQLAAHKHELERRLSLDDSGATLIRRARRLGLVKPGERLFIVQGIAAWRRAQRAAGTSR